MVAIQKYGLFQLKICVDLLSCQCWFCLLCWWLLGQIDHCDVNNSPSQYKPCIVFVWWLEASHLQNAVFIWGSNLVQTVMKYEKICLESSAFGDLCWLILVFTRNVGDHVWTVTRWRNVVTVELIYISPWRETLQEKVRRFVYEEERV